MHTNDKPETLVKVSCLVQKIIALPRPVLLAFDLDGTLAEMTPDPHDTAVPRVVSEALERLSHHPALRIAIVTGRDLSAFTRMVQLTGIWRVLEHGGLIFPPGAVPQAPKITEAQESQLLKFETWAKKHAVPLGADLEVKRAARGIHVRQLASTNPVLADQLVMEASHVASVMGLYVRTGRKMVEADSLHSRKVTALEHIWLASHAKGLVFAGDDHTDFEAIRFARQHGIGVFVRSLERPRGPRAAILKGPAEIREMLEQLSKALRQTKHEARD